MYSSSKKISFPKSFVDVFFVVFSLARTWSLPTVSFQTSTTLCDWQGGGWFGTGNGGISRLGSGWVRGCVILFVFITFRYFPSLFVNIPLYIWKRWESQILWSFLCFLLNFFFIFLNILFVHLFQAYVSSICMKNCYRIVYSTTLCLERFVYV